MLSKILNCQDEKKDISLSRTDVKNTLKEYIRILAANVVDKKKAEEYIKKIETLDTEVSKDKIENFKNEFLTLLDSLVKNEILQENVITLLTNIFNKVTDLLEKGELLNDAEVEIIKNIDILTNEAIKKLGNFLTKQNTSFDTETSSNDKTEKELYAVFALLDEYLRIINAKLLENLQATNKTLHKQKN